MKLAQKIVRMAMGYDKYHINHDPMIPCGEAEQIAKEEAAGCLEAYRQALANLVDASAPIYLEGGNVEAVEAAKKLLEETEMGGRYGNVHTTD